MCISVTDLSISSAMCAGVNPVFTISAWTILVNWRRHLLSEEMRSSWISEWGEKVGKGWLEKLRRDETECQVPSFKNLLRATFSLKLPLITHIRSGSPWTSPAFIAEMKVNVYSISIVTLWWRWLYTTLILLIIHSLNIYWARTVCPPTDQAWRRRMK